MCTTHSPEAQHHLQEHINRARRAYTYATAIREFLMTVSFDAQTGEPTYEVKVPRSTLTTAVFETIGKALFYPDLMCETFTGEELMKQVAQAEADNKRFDPSSKFE